MPSHKARLRSPLSEGEGWVRVFNPRSFTPKSPQAEPSPQPSPSGRGGRKDRFGGIVLIVVLAPSLWAWCRSDAGQFRRIVGLRGVIQIASPYEGRPWNREIATWPESATDVIARADQVLSPARGWHKSGPSGTAKGAVTYSRVESTSIINRTLILRMIFNAHPYDQVAKKVTIWPAYASPVPSKYPVTSPWTTIAMDEEILTGWRCGAIDPEWDLNLVRAPL